MLYFLITLVNNINVIMEIRLYIMKIRRILMTSILLAGAVLIANTPGFCQGSNYIEKMFDIRTSISDQGKVLPGKIREKTGNDLRTLERIFELNTSTLTTIEAYFRILKIAISTGSESSPQTIDILNGWLTFIDNQCDYDMEYLDEAMNETTDESVIEQLALAKDNIEKLSETVKTGLGENKRMLE